MSMRRALSCLLMVLLAAAAGCSRSGDAGSSDQAADQRSPHAGLYGNNNKSLTLLMQAVDARDMTQLEKLLQSGAPVDERGPRGETALMRAARQGRTTMVQRLLAAKASPDLQQQEGKTALYLAAYESYGATAQALLAAGAAPDIKTSPDYLQDTALFPAVAHGDEALVRALVQAGADVNAADGRGATPLMDAANGSLAMVSLLLELGANANARSLSGGTALDIARREQRQDIVRLLQRAARTRPAKPGR